MSTLTLPRPDRKTRVLFIGDSITDVGRRDDPATFGNGYVRMIRDVLASGDPAHCPVIINRGISGNQVTHLAERWDADVLAETPDVISIKIGINDVWRQLDGKAPGVDVSAFAETYRGILEKTRAALPVAKLVFCEPTVITAPAPEGNAMLQPYIKAVHEMAAEFGGIIVPLHKTFADAMATRPDIVWAADGVHPSPTGHMLIARTWLETVGWW